MNNKPLKKIYLLLAILVMIIIFLFSAKTGEQSMNQSDKVVEAINSIATTSKPIDSYTHLFFNLSIRKIAHIFLYALLGTFVYLWADKITLSIVICYIYAIFDELHQYYVAGRLASIDDTFIDALGFIGAIFLISIFRKIYFRFRFHQLIENKNR